MTTLGSKVNNWSSNYLESCVAKSARCYKAELFYDVVESKRRHWFAVTLSFTPCGDRQTDKIKICLTIATRRETESYSKPMPPF